MKFAKPYIPEAVEAAETPSEPVVLRIRGLEPRHEEWETFTLRGLHIKPIDLSAAYEAIVAQEVPEYIVQRGLDDLANFLRVQMIAKTIAERTEIVW